LKIRAKKWKELSFIGAIGKSDWTGMSPVRGVAYASLSLALLLRMFLAYQLAR
jgi:hypothetical protein